MKQTLASIQKQKIKIYDNGPNNETSYSMLVFKMLHKYTYNL